MREGGAGRPAPSPACLLALVLLLSGAGAARAASVPAGCVPAGDVAVIVDDSSSMRGSDPRGLRRRALQPRGPS